MVEAPVKTGARLPSALPFACAGDRGCYQRQWSERRVARRTVGHTPTRAAPALGRKLAPSLPRLPTVAAARVLGVRVYW